MSRRRHYPWNCQSCFLLAVRISASFSENRKPSWTYLNSAVKMLLVIGGRDVREDGCAIGGCDLADGGPIVKVSRSLEAIGGSRCAAEDELELAISGGSPGNKERC